ncbi:hypothetical protein ACFXKW_20950 [Streptomyces sp. NPDC059193]|uniref:hypothetical protein n=1 Tax=Streptomyces sp. NPDC059193 TaxID=3346763 RepID=UPI003690F063
MMLPAGTRVLSDPATGRGTLITPDGKVWRLNMAATVAFSTLAAGGTAADAEAAMARRWPDILADTLRQDLDEVLTALSEGEATS